MKQLETGIFAHIIANMMQMIKILSYVGRVDVIESLLIKIIVFYGHDTTMQHGVNKV